MVAVTVCAGLARSVGGGGPVCGRAALSDAAIRALSISVDAVAPSIEPDLRSDCTYDLNSESSVSTASSLSVAESERACATNASSLRSWGTVSLWRAVAGLVPA